MPLAKCHASGPPAPDFSHFLVMQLTFFGGISNKGQLCMWSPSLPGPPVSLQRSRELKKTSETGEPSAALFLRQEVQRDMKSKESGSERSDFPPAVGGHLSFEHRISKVPSDVAEF